MSNDLTQTGVKRGAPLGNDNGKKGSEFREAVRRALARSAGTVGKGLDKLCDQLIVSASAGEQWAMQMVADRLDGKAAQTVYVGEAPELIEAPSGNELTNRLNRALAGRSAIDAEEHSVQ
jgi:hypothetical protein